MRDRCRSCAPRAKGTSKKSSKQKSRRGYAKLKQKDGLKVRKGARLRSERKWVLVFVVVNRRSQCETAQTKHREGGKRKSACGAMQCRQSCPCAQGRKKENRSKRLNQPDKKTIDTVIRFAQRQMLVSLCHVVDGNALSSGFQP
jgi:hypothetical protein